MESAQEFAAPSIPNPTIDAKQPRGHVAPRLWAGVATGIGFLLALAATLAPDNRTAPGSAAAPVTLALPGWTAAIALVALSAAGLIFLAVVLARPRRRRKKGAEDYELYHEPRRVPKLLAIGLILVALAPAAGLGAAMFWFGRWTMPLQFEAGGARIGASRPAPTVAPVSPPARPARPASTVTTGLLGTMVLLVGFGSLGFVLWLVFGDRWPRRLPAGRQHRTPELAAAIDDSLEALRREPDPRAAILKIYGNFERALAGAEMARRPWQTPIEFMRAILARPPLPAPPVQRLTRLFEIARFSRHRVGTAERDGAWQSLIEIRAALSASSEARDARLS